MKFGGGASLVGFLNWPARRDSPYSRASRAPCAGEGAAPASRAR